MKVSKVVIETPNGTITVEGDSTLTAACLRMFTASTVKQEAVQNGDTPKTPRRHARHLKRGCLLKMLQFVDRNNGSVTREGLVNHLEAEGWKRKNLWTAITQARTAGFLVIDNDGTVLTTRKGTTRARDERMIAYGKK